MLYGDRHCLRATAFATKQGRQCVQDPIAEFLRPTRRKRSLCMLRCMQGPDAGPALHDRHPSQRPGRVRRKRLCLHVAMLCCTASARRTETCLCRIARWGLVQQASSAAVGPLNSCRPTPASICFASVRSQRRLSSPWGACSPPRAPAAPCRPAPAVSRSLRRTSALTPRWAPCRVERTCVCIRHTSGFVACRAPEGHLVLPQGHLSYPANARVQMISSYGLDVIDFLAAGWVMPGDLSPGKVRQIQKNQSWHDAQSKSSFDVPAVQNPQEE